LDLGCQHARGESYLATGILNTTTIEHERCENSCGICTKRWHEQFLPVYRSGVVGFLEYLMLIGKLPQDINDKDQISSLLAGSAFWKETIFDRAAGGISRIQVDELFLSLAASGIIQLRPKNDTLQWDIVWEYGIVYNNTSFIDKHIGVPTYKRSEDAWQGIHLFSENHVRRRNPVPLYTRFAWA
jgi:hypothetical protein